MKDSSAADPLPQSLAGGASEAITAEIVAFERSMLVVAERARAVDRAHYEGMWRTWKLQGIADAEVEARAAASLAFSTLPADRPELRALVEQRFAELETFLAKYPGRKPF